jgi:hypothetical protein
MFSFSRWIALLLPLTLLALGGCPEPDDDDSASDDDTADDDAGDDDAGDDDAGDDDSGDDDSGDDDSGDDDGGDDDGGDDDSGDDDSGDDDDSTPSGPDIDAAPPQLNFGVLCVGDPPTILSLTLSNYGDADLTITTMQIANCTNATLPPMLPTMIPPSTSVPLDVSGHCVIENACNGNLVIESNDPDESPLLIPISVTCDEC